MENSTKKVDIILSIIVKDEEGVYSQTLKSLHEFNSYLSRRPFDCMRHKLLITTFSIGEYIDLMYMLQDETCDFENVQPDMIIDMYRNLNDFNLSKCSDMNNLEECLKQIRAICRIAVNTQRYWET